MEYTDIKGVKEKQARIGLGTWAIGGWMWGGTDEKESIKTIHTALDKGINMIDTAPAYGFGKSEEITGKAIKEYGGREKIVLATKTALEWDDNENVKRNATKERIFKEIEDSLRRLQTDYIDIYQVHWPDPLVDVEETAEAMTALIDDGKILAAGVSNFSPKQMEKFKSVCPLSTNQPPYNLFEREIEDDVLPWCRDNDIKLITYGALCRGMLSGKMSTDREFKGDDLRQADPKFQQPRFDQYLKATELLKQFAKEKYGKDLIHLAVRWLLDHGADISLWGARKPSQLDNLEGVWGWNLSDKDMEEIDGIITRNVKDPVGPEFMAPPSRK
ncbi:MAG: aldo/keto reductase [Candidatus Kapaibacterium sp.]